MVPSSAVCVAEEWFDEVLAHPSTPEPHWVCDNDGRVLRTYHWVDHITLAVCATNTYTGQREVVAWRHRVRFYVDNTAHSHHNALYAVHVHVVANDEWFHLHREMVIAKKFENIWDAWYRDKEREIYTIGDEVYVQRDIRPY